MALAIVIDLIVVLGLFRITLAEGLEAALPFASFMLVFVPIEASIPLGLFALTTQRLIVIVLLFLYIFAGRKEAGLVNSLSMPLKALILLHVCWCALSTANSVVPIMSIKKALSVICEYYALYFVYWRTVSKTETIHKVLFAIVLAVIVCSVFGAFEAYGAGNVLSLLPRGSHHFDLTAETDREVRVQSTFDHPILFGAALAMAITLTLYLITVAKKSWQAAFLWVGLMLMFLSIYKTSSRGPWLDVMLGCVLLVVLSGNKVRKRILVIGLLGVAAMVIRPGIWATVEGIYENTFDMNTSTGTSYQYRYALSHAVTDRLLQSPTRALWGYGLESFYDLQIEGEFLGEPHVFLSCDNAWAELTAETGFVGLFIIAVMLLAPAWVAFRDYQTLPAPDKYLSLVLLVNLLIFYFQMYSVGMYSWGQNGYMLWILIALTFAYRKCREKEARVLGAEDQELPADIEPAFQTT